MATLRQSAATLVLGLSLIFVYASQLSAQNPQAPEVKTGCLTAGPSSGTYLLIVDMSGERLTITGLALEALKLDQKVTATGTTMRTGNTAVFQATKVEPINQPCQIGFSVDNLKKSIGHARIGVHGGVALDPELITVGVHAELGPVIQTIWFRPTAEFAFGEVTKIASLSTEVAYYLPFTGYGRSGTRWNSYIGGGPSVSFVKRDFEGIPGHTVEFSDWDTDWGATLFVGIAQSSGAFFEIKGGVWTVPSVRLTLGYSFK